MQKPHHVLTVLAPNYFSVSNGFKIRDHENKGMGMLCILGMSVQGEGLWDFIVVRQSMYNINDSESQP